MSSIHAWTQSCVGFRDAPGGSTRGAGDQCCSKDPFTDLLSAALPGCRIHSAVAPLRSILLQAVHPSGTSPQRRMSGVTFCVQMHVARNGWAEKSLPIQQWTFERFASPSRSRYTRSGICVQYRAAFLLQKSFVQGASRISADWSRIEQSCGRPISCYSHPDHQ